MAVTIPFRERLTCSPDEAAGATGLGIATIWRTIRAGSLRSTKVGIRRLASVPALIAIVDGEPRTEP